MKIIGYSERGLINSLLFEIKYSQNSLEILNQFLTSITFPYRNITFKVLNVKILIEQSFSDFGDADMVFLVNNNENKQIIFIEAKVKTFQNQCWTIRNEFEQLKEGIQQNKVSSSNLFTQLYHKLRLTQTLQRGGLNQLQKGVRFPVCSSKTNRKIGNNKVVLKAVNELVPYCGDVLFVALVPDITSDLDSFYQKILKNYSPDRFQDWDVKNWGYLSWEKVEAFCKINNLEGTLKAFEWNEGQIYKKRQGNSR